MRFKVRRAPIFEGPGPEDLDKNGDLKKGIRTREVTLEELQAEYEQKQDKD